MSNDQKAVIEALERSAVNLFEEELAGANAAISDRLNAFDRGRGAGGMLRVFDAQDVLLGLVRAIADRVVSDFIGSVAFNGQEQTDALRRTMDVLNYRVLAIHDQRITRNGETEPHRQEFIAKCKAIADRRLHDFTSGIAHNRARPRAESWSISAVNGNVAVTHNSPGAQAQAGHHLRQQMQWDPTQLLLGLGKIHAEVAALRVETAAKDEIVDAIVNLQREAERAEPELGRIRRLADALGRRFIDLGIGVGAGLIAGYVIPHLPPL